MQFVSTMDQSQQIDEVCQFLKEHLASSVKDSAELKGFDEKLDEL
jgi:NMD protein affecting ribosome stability and mRNA decay